MCIYIYVYTHTQERIYIYTHTHTDSARRRRRRRTYVIPLRRRRGDRRVYIITDAHTYKIIILYNVIILYVYHIRARIIVSNSFLILCTRKTRPRGSAGRRSVVPRVQSDSPNALSSPSEELPEFEIEQTILCCL